jgi:hypothetical protein
MRTTRRRPFQQLVQRLPRPAVNRIKRAIASPVAWNLDALAVLWGTDKALGHHGYTRYYARHLNRRSVGCVLEIGIGENQDPARGGNSLLMWRSYFPNATVYGLDLHKKRLDEPRIVAIQADQSDPASLERAVAGCPPFDLVVDDGSHVASHVATSFETLFPKVKPGGFYAIEDLVFAYMRDYGGGPPGTRGTAVDLAKGLVDHVNIGPRPIAAVYAYPGLALIERADAPGGSTDEEMRRWLRTLQASDAGLKSADARAIEARMDRPRAATEEGSVEVWQEEDR